MSGVLLAVTLLFQQSIAVPLPSQCGKPAIEPILPTPNARIVGGNAAVPYSWPWQVQIRYGNVHHCGASIIANDWLITAAHCLEGYLIEKFIFRAGRYAKIGDEEPYEQTVKAKSFILHDNFSPSTLDNDIALVQLEKALLWTDQVSPVCLPTQSNDDPVVGSLMYVTGWGDVMGTGYPHLLKQAAVPVIDRVLCNQEDWHDQWVTTNMFCAGYERGGTDSCQGDSGGPLVNKTAHGWQLNGVVSWGGDICATERKPGVYAKVSLYISWITSKIS